MKKPGSNSVGTGKGGTGMAGNAGKALPSKPFAGPKSTGGPVSLKKALKKKAVPGGNATGFAGLVR